MSLQEGLGVYCNITSLKIIQVTIMSIIILMIMTMITITKISDHNICITVNITTLREEEEEYD